MGGGGGVTKYGNFSLFDKKMRFSQTVIKYPDKITDNISKQKNPFGSAEQNNEHMMTSPHHEHCTVMPK